MTKLENFNVVRTEWNFDLWDDSLTDKENVKVMIAGQTLEFIKPTLIEGEDGQVLISAEDGKYLADYYDMMHINTQLDAYCTMCGLHIEWQDCGTLSVSLA